MPQQQGQYGPEDIVSPPLAPLPAQQGQAPGGQQGQFGPEDIVGATGDTTGGTPDQPAPYTDVGGFFRGLPTGIAKGVAGLSALAGKGLGSRDPERIKQLEQFSQTMPLGTPGHELEAVGQNIGGGLEGLGEMYLGGKLVQGAELGDLLTHMGKFGQFYENSSAFVKGLIDRTLNSARQMTVGAGVGGIHGGVPGALIGAAAGAVPTGYAGVKEAVKGFPSAEGIAPVREPPTVMNPAQKVLQNNITEVAEQIAKDAGVKPQPGPFWQTLNNLQDALDEKATEIYKKVDDASGNAFFPVKRKIAEIDMQLKQEAGTAFSEEEQKAETELIAKKRQLEGELQNIIKDAADPAKTKNPITEADANEADRRFRQQSAVGELSAHLQAALPGHLQAYDVPGGEGPEMRIKAWSDRVEKMYRGKGYTGNRLAEAMNQDPAVGKPIAEVMKTDAREAVRQEAATKALEDARQEEIGRLTKAREDRVKAIRGVLTRAAGTVTGGGLVAGGVEAYRALKPQQ